MDRTIRPQDATKSASTASLGYVFNTFWGRGVESEKTKNSLYFKQIEFANGKKIILSCFTSSPRNELTNPNPLGDMLPPDDVRQMLGFLGEKADSGFEYMNLLLSTRDEDVRNSDSLEKAQAISKLLTLKALQISPKQAYRFDAGSVKGFQFGEYSTPSSISVMLYPDNAFGCSINANESSGINQDDVDLIISTFRPL
ncbi:MAG TPA: hypothetical protein VIR98_03195 [Candidatus Paceibacterota bacterium]